ncbi:hypothetical protein C5B96_13205 [Subtercola sp. Z020]|uniref:hypothetical protein n=1 Tax=Subtercola sp. Z020 TaxID=2080582 RepID=UPI000CE7798D|nr:hypothetical protein [Subtercola sp. Z020]PPF79219.1 hypothetical protein C5B96_13205 [Subtercola sp. Z020]
MAEPGCALAHCYEPATKVAVVTQGGRTAEVPVCSEHFHDIDWGVVPRRSLIEAATRLGLFSAATGEESQAG